MKTLLKTALWVGVSVAGAAIPRSSGPGFAVVQPQGERLDCNTLLTLEIQKAIATPEPSRWEEVLKGKPSITLYESVAVALPDGNAGWLATGGCRGDINTKLIWVVPRRTGSIVQLPLAHLKETGWNFLSVNAVGDFDKDGALEAFIVGTGGAGMYYHYPIILRLMRVGVWQVEFWAAEPFFFGATEILPPTADGKIQLALTSVDQDAPWSFEQCSFCEHPFKREVYVLAKGKLRLKSKQPVPSAASTLSDFLLGARERRFDDLFAHVSESATIAGNPVSTGSALQKVLDDLAITRQGTVCLEERAPEKESQQKPAEQLPTVEIEGKNVVVIGHKEIEEGVIYFYCSGDEFKTETHYEARLKQAGQKWLLESLELRKKASE